MEVRFLAVFWVVVLVLAGCGPAPAPAAVTATPTTEPTAILVLLRPHLNLEQVLGGYCAKAWITAGDDPAAVHYDGSVEWSLTDRAGRVILAEVTSAPLWCFPHQFPGGVYEVGAAIRDPGSVMKVTQTFTVAAPAGEP